MTLQIAYDAWFKKCDALYQADGRKRKLGYHLESRFGRKYIKVCNNTGNQTGAWAFVEMETGNIYKPAHWKRPELNKPRGNIYDEHGGMKYITWTGPMYIDSIKKVKTQEEAEDYNNPKWYES